MRAINFNAGPAGLPLPALERARDEFIDFQGSGMSILEPLLGIADPRRDPRIEFVGGIRGTTELQARVDRGEARAAFALWPTSMQELLAISDAGQIMPPKSTWFEPKLRSGLLLHPF